MNDRSNLTEHKSNFPQTVFYEVVFLFSIFFFLALLSSLKQETNLLVQRWTPTCSCNNFHRIRLLLRYASCIVLFPSNVGVVWRKTCSSTTRRHSHTHEKKRSPLIRLPLIYESLFCLLLPVANIWVTVHCVKTLEMLIHSVMPWWVSAWSPCLLA